MIVCNLLRYARLNDAVMGEDVFMFVITQYGISVGGGIKKFDYLQWLWTPINKLCMSSSQQPWISPIINRFMCYL